MEPPNLNSSPDHALETELRRLHAATAALPDNGFSARVLAALPPQRPPRFTEDQRRLWLVTGGALAGLAIVLKHGQGIDWDELALSFHWLESPDFNPLETLRFDSPLVIALAATVASLALVKLLDILQPLKRWENR